MKVCWIDTETTGLDKNIHGIWQIAVLIDIDGQVVDEQNFLCNPDTVWDEETKRFSSVSPEEVEEFTPISQVKTQLKKLLTKYVNQYDCSDKFTAAGYNVQFDMGFLEILWQRCGDKYLYSLFTHRFLDVKDLYIVGEWLRVASNLPRYRLEDVARAVGIEFDVEGTHDALFDIKLTRDVAMKLRSQLKGGDHARKRVLRK